MVTGKVILKHGDRLVIGGNHYFKVSSPYDEHSNIQISAQAVDYEFAHQEILKVQEEKYEFLIALFIQQMCVIKRYLTLCYF